MKPAQDIDEAFAAMPRRGDKPLIGASVVGNPCTAYLSFALRGFPSDKPDPQLQRIFRDGHRIEAVVVGDLRKAGYHVMEIDPMTGQQWGYQSYGGHVRCRADGHIEDKDSDDVFLLEIKSMNDASHNTFKKKGVKVSHRHYYDQCQLEMEMSGMTKTLFIAYNKNNSQYHSEIIEYDPFDSAALRVKIESVLRNEGKKIATDESSWFCKGCFHLSVCWRGASPDTKECRFCKHAVANHGGGWWCRQHNQNAEDACDDYETYHPLPRE